MIKINEVFFSIQGESSYVGVPTVFVRTTGCNLRCTYCDTKYSYSDGNFWTLDDLISKIDSYKAKYVCLTGGEPLLQSGIYPLMSALCDAEYLVSLETSGSKPCHRVDSRVKIVLDIKTPDSGAAESFDFSNFEILRPQTEVKFVICSEIDFAWAESFCKRHSLFSRCIVLFSPSFGVISPNWLAEKILASQSSARLQLQLHKYIWSPETRGV
jgi:7-carboxy-7-deazaguanine synthase